MSYKVFVTRLLPERGMKMLRAAPEIAELRVNPHDRVITRAELEEGVRWCDALISLLTEPIDAALMDLNCNLKIVANYAVGFNNVDVAAATARKIPVSNTPEVLTETTADLTFALMLAAARRVVEADRFMRAGKYEGWGPMMFLGGDVHGRTLGIVGLGRIGYAVARRARGFNMKVLYSDVRRLDQKLEQAVEAKFVDLDTLLRESDFVTLHPFLSPETHHLMNEARLKMMKPTAYLINASRGPVIDENALVSALRKGWIAGAGLDVFENEPAMATGLAELDNVVVVPHIASASFETRARMAEIAAENVIAALRGQRAATCVNPEVYG